MDFFEIYMLMALIGTIELEANVIEKTWDFSLLTESITFPFQISKGCTFLKH
jgi:hypothetical protein